MRWCFWIWIQYSTGQQAVTEAQNCSSVGNLKLFQISQKHLLSGMTSLKETKMKTLSRHFVAIIWHIMSSIQINSLKIHKNGYLRPINVKIRDKCRISGNKTASPREFVLIRLGTVEHKNDPKYFSMVSSNY